MNTSDSPPLQPDRQVLASLAALSYRAGDLNDYLQDIVRGISALLQTDWSIVTIVEGNAGRIVASSLDLGEGNEGFEVHGSLIGEVVRERRSIFIEDVRKEDRPHKPPAEYRCYMGVPLTTFNGETLGTICSFLHQPRVFSTDEVCAAELFAERAATAIDNYRLYQRQSQFNEHLKAELAAYAIELQATQAKTIEYERLAAIGEFTSTIVHEIRNPLTTVEMGLRHASKVLSNDRDRERLDLALAESQRLKQLLNEILMYAKPQNLELAEVDVGEFLQTLWLQFQDLPEAIDRHLELTVMRSGITVLADRDKLKQVFFNLVKNALEAIAPNESVRCELGLDREQQRVSIEIHNGGNPITPEILPKLMTPFCSTKASGTGLGLAIVKRIVMAHDGEISIASNAAGTIVKVRFPIAK